MKTAPFPEMTCFPNAVQDVFSASPGCQGFSLNHAKDFE